MTNPNTGKVPLTVYLPVPPEGMEWQIREPVPQREYYAGKMVNIEAVLRPIVPATVMVEMTVPRSTAEYYATNFDHPEPETHLAEMVDAARAAIARRPCPVMVCALYGGKSRDCWRKDTHDQRPCKHKDGEGHGGEHE